MPPDKPRVLVTDKVTGEQSFVVPGEFDSELQELAADQVATVDPLGAGGEFAVGQEVTERSLAGGLIEGVTPEARAALTAEQVESDVFDNTSNTVEQTLLGVGSGATFGLLPSVLASDDPFERDRQRRERAAGGGAFGTGELVGNIVPGLFSGGTGFAGTLARLTPAGRLAALSGRIASRGSGLAGKVATGSLSGAIEGAAQGVGDFIARDALSDKPFSAEALVSSAGIGGLFGAVAGGAIPALGAAGRSIQRLRGRRPASLADLAVDETAALRAFDDDLVLDPVRGPRAELESPTRISRPTGEQSQRRTLEALERSFEPQTLRFDQVVSRQAREETGESFGALLSHVDDTATTSARAIGEDIPSLVTQMDDVGIDDALRNELTAALSASADDLGRASERASIWGAQATRELGVDAGGLTAKTAGRELSEALDDLGADALAELDHAATQYATSSAAVRDSLAEAVEGANAAALVDPSAIGRGGVGERVTGVTERMRAALANRSGAFETAGTVLGAAEVARDVGGLDIPTARDIPGIGQAVSLWARYKAGSNALRRVGVLPASGLTRAAAGVNSTRSRLESFVSRAARGIAVKAASPLGRRLGSRSAKAVASELADLQARDPQAVGAEVAASIGAETPDLAQAAGAAAARAHAYLQAQAPRNPLDNTILADKWRPTSLERKQWGVVVAAVRNPLAAVQSSLTEAYPDRAIAAVKAVYPAIFAETQARLTLRADKLRGSLPRGRLQALGRVFEIPLTISQQPTYLPVLPAKPDPAAVVANAPAPRASTTSPIGTLEQTAQQARRANL